MTNELKDKLRLEIGKKLDSESRVVYILSRIRKIIELEKTRGKYKRLNVYCNWSLHSEIDRAEDIKDILEKFVNKAELRSHFLYFDDFRKELKRFIKDVLNLEITGEYLNKFVSILISVISDTPISIKKSKTLTITINPSELPREENQITYKITEHDL